MGQLKISILTDAESSATEILAQCKHPEIGREYLISKDLSVTILGVTKQSSMMDSTASELISLAINLGTSITASVVARWLYDTLKGKAKKVLIDSESVEIEVRKIEEVIIRKSTNS